MVWVELYDEVDGLMLVVEGKNFRRVVQLP